jgi:hypothetical protein
MRRTNHDFLSLIFQFDSKAESSQKMADDKLDHMQAQVETLENGRSPSLGLDLSHEAGSVQLLDSHHVVLVPTPSRDPKGE